MKHFIIALLDFIYTPFQKFIDRQTFRYVACGGGNTLLDIIIYFVTYNFILKKQIVHTPFISISPYIASFIISFFVTFPIGFLLMRNIVFTGSTLRGRIQLIRYFAMVVVCVVLNYIFIKLFVEQFGFYPTIAKVVTTIIVVCFSYLTQRHFTFKTKTKN
ncbi:MAG: GtrA family protein [Terrimonas sp.]|nr:GtrA family protein [Terrimonas sp.]OJY88184.1 MAG: phenylalanine 4-monooxygenase [Sphingobacteriales bacterium 40-81]